MSGNEIPLMIILEPINFKIILSFKPKDTIGILLINYLLRRNHK